MKQLSTGLVDAQGMECFEDPWVGNFKATDAGTFGSLPDLWAFRAGESAGGPAHSKTLARTMRPTVKVPRPANITTERDRGSQNDGRGDSKGIINRHDYYN